MFWNVFTDVVDHIPQKRIYAHEINGKLFVYMGDFTFEIRARAVRHVIAITHEGTPAWTMTNSHQPGEPTEKYTDLFGHGYTIDLYNSPVSLGRAVCNRKKLLNNTAWSRRRRHQADDTNLA